MGLKLLFAIASLFIAGCAKFDYLQGGFASALSFQILSPTSGSALVPSATFTITGTCDPAGGPIDITGSSFAEPSLSGTCDPVLSTFSINATAISNGQNLDIQASQLDNEGSLISSVINTVMIHCAGPAMRTCASMGSGNPVDPYMIGNVSCLQEMRDGLYCHYALNNDIDASATSNWNFDGTNFRGWEPVPVTQNLVIRFTGTLDGRNHTISGLFITPRDINGAGLFSRIGDEGNGSVDDQIYDLTLSNALANNIVFTTSPFGLLAGRTDLVGVRNVRVINGTIDLLGSVVNLERIGLLVGDSLNSEFSDSQTSGTISFGGNNDNNTVTYSNVGGFIGFVTGGSLTNNSTNISMTTAANVQRFQNIGGAFGTVLSRTTVDRFNVNTNIDLFYNGLSATNALGGAINTIGGFAGRSADGTNQSQICVSNNINLESLSGSIRGFGGYSGYIGPLTTAGSLPVLNNQISVRGTVSINSHSLDLFSIAGFIGTLGNSTNNNIYSNSNISIFNTAGPTPSGYSGVANQRGGVATSFSNVITTSDHNVTSSTISVPVGVFYNILGLTNSNFFYANDLSLGGLPIKATAGASPGITEDSFANLAALTNASYTGFDFATIWQRDSITNIPELRFCP